MIHRDNSRTLSSKTEWWIKYEYTIWILFSNGIEGLDSDMPPNVITNFSPFSASRDLVSNNVFLLTMSHFFIGGWGKSSYENKKLHYDDHSKFSFAFGLAIYEERVRTAKPSNHLFIIDEICSPFTFISVKIYSKRPHDFF